jgi:uncharacterized protein (TIGR02300 family)
VAKPELGIKRVCPVTGRKFYDLNRDPVVSPYSGQAYPRSYFEPQAKAPVRDEEEEEVEAAPVELVALEEVDAPDAAAKDVVVEDIDEDIVADEEDTFLEADEEDEDDVSDLIDGDIVDDEES